MLGVHMCRIPATGNILYVIVHYSNSISTQDDNVILEDLIGLMESHSKILIELKPSTQIFTVVKQRFSAYIDSCSM